MKSYISGGMTDVPEFNFPMFDSASAAWRACGNEAVSPAEHDREVLLRERGLRPEDVPGYAFGNWTEYEASVGQLGDLLAWDFVQIAQECDSIVMLPGWQHSTGAKAERFVAEMTGKLVILAVPHTVLPLSVYGEWAFREDPIQKRLQLHVEVSSGVGVNA